MKCKNVKDNIILYLNNLLTDNKMEEFNLHISRCEKCLHMVENVKLTINLFEKREDNLEFPYFYTRLKQKMENKSQKSNIGFSRIKVLQHSTILILIILGLFIGHYIGNQYTNSTINLTEDIRNSEIKVYADENYISGINNDNYEILLTSNQ